MTDTQSRLSPSTSLSSRPQRQLMVAYLMAVFLGVFGVHRFYLGRPRTGFFLLALTVFGALLTRAAYGALLITLFPVLVVTAAVGCAPLAWVVVDLFLIPRMVRDCNAQQQAGLWQGAAKAKPET